MERKTRGNLFDQMVCKKIVTLCTTSCTAHRIDNAIYNLAGSAVMFNVESLVDYILSTGDFTDPETRILFSEDDLVEIDETVRKLQHY